MSDSRAAKSGFALEAQKKIQEKYDPAVAAKCMQWIKDVTGEASLDTSGSVQSVKETLMDGIVLLKLYQKLDPACTSIRDIKQRKMKFTWIERLGQFNTLIKGPVLGVPEHSTFTPENLIEETNMAQVITCLETVARKSLALGKGGFGPKEAEANKREFSEEQLAQGKSIIGLQMGSNKGASQAGQNFGKSRMIMD